MTLEERIMEIFRVSSSIKDAYIAIQDELQLDADDVQSVLDKSRHRAEACWELNKLLNRLDEPGLIIIYALIRRRINDDSRLDDAAKKLCNLTVEELWEELNGLYSISSNSN